MSLSFNTGLISNKRKGDANIASTEEQIDAIKVDLQNQIAIVEKQINELNSDFKIINQETTLYVVQDAINSLQSKLDGYKFKLNLIDNGYMGADKIYASNEVIHRWRD